MKIQHVFILALLLVILSGCGSQRKTVTKYYLIELPQKAEISVKENNTHLQGICEITPVQIVPAYSTQKIVLRSNTHEIKFYSYHFWAQRPNESLNIILKDYFNHTGIFEGIATQYWRLSPDYKIITNVSHLEMTEQDEQVSAHLAFEMKLIDSRENQVLQVHRADRYQQLAKKDLNTFAQVTGKLLYDELNKFSKKIITNAVEQ